MQNWRMIKDRVGSWYQVAGTRSYVLTEGSTAGTRAIDVKTGGGLSYTVVPDRGLDISLASYKGVNIVYQGACGEVNPAYYNCMGSEWLRLFNAGLLTTCGPNNISSPCIDDGEALGLHGRFNSTPARSVCDLTNIERDDGRIHITGEIDCSVLFGARVRVRRSITSPVGGSTVVIEDVVENVGGQATPLCMLYHINMGYPLLDDCTTIAINSANIKPYDAHSAQYLHEIGNMSPPETGNREKNYLHSFAPEAQIGRATIHNGALGFGVYIESSLASLPYISQWKMEGVREYVLGIEPCNVPCEARDSLRKKGLLPFLAPGETVTHRVEIGILEA